MFLENESVNKNDSNFIQYVVNENKIELWIIVQKVHQSALFSEEKKQNLV